MGLPRLSRASLVDRLAPRAGFIRTGHRGARGLAPENTLAGFHAAAEAGVDILELDVQLTADREVVVIHDPTVDRTTDGTGPVATQPWADLAPLDAGHHWTTDDGATFPRRGEQIGIPRLIDVLNAFPEHLFTVELKPSPLPNYEETVIEIVRELAPGRVILASFVHAILGRIHRLAPEIPTNLSNREIHYWYPLTLLGLGSLIRAKGRVLQIPYWSNHDDNTGWTLVTPRTVRSTHRNGRSIQVWTINDPDLMRTLIERGVDGITTDRPDVLNDVLAGLT